MTLDGKSFTGEEIDFCGLQSGKHSLVVKATDDSGNMGEGSATFTVEPQPLESSIIRHMRIHWARDEEKWWARWWKRHNRDDRFNIFGRLQLPEGFTVSDLERSATVTIIIAGEQGNDTAVFKERPLRRPGFMWKYRGGKRPFSEGVNITKMTIWWSPQRNKGAGWAGFHIRGVLKLPEGIGKDTETAEATVTVEIPVTTEAGCGSLLGEEKIEFKVHRGLKLWSYHVWPELPYNPYDHGDAE